MLNLSTTIKLFFLSLFETDQQEKDSFFKLSLSILSTIIILVLLNVIIYSVYPDNSEAIAIQAKQLIIEVDHYWIWPEPVEKFQFLTTLFSTGSGHIQ